MASTAWSIKERRVLLNLWGNNCVQRQLKGVVRNKAVYEEIQHNLGSLGYQRTWLQCQVKVKNLIAAYRKIKDNNHRSGQGKSAFIFLNLFQRILGLDQPLDRPISYQTLPHTQQQPNHQHKTQSLHMRKVRDSRLLRKMRLKKRKEGEDQDSAPHQENEDADSNKGEDRE